MTASIAHNPDIDKPMVMGRAVLEAAHILGLTKSQLAAVLGVSPSAISRLPSGAYRLEPDTKVWELARLFLRVYRSLAGIIGGNDDLLRAWMTGTLKPLAARPVDLVQTAQGLVHVADYLDAMRAKV